MTSASLAILCATPYAAHAATGAKAGPTHFSIIEICAAGMLAMFQSRFGDTLAHGSSGQPHFLLSARMRFSFWRMFDSFAEPEDAGTGSPWIAAASTRYSCSALLFAAQNASHTCF